MSPTRRRFLFGATACLIPQAIRAAEPAPPVWRLAPEGWGKAAAADVKAVLGSAIGEMWRYFPGRKLEPFLILRGHQGPIVQYQRNTMKEIVVWLDTQDLYWCQYTYQIAHEFCHILSGFDDDWKGNLWFEESLCETASLFVLRRLAQTWTKNPPFESWRAYAPRFSEYAEDIMSRRATITDAPAGRFLSTESGGACQKPREPRPQRCILPESPAAAGGLSPVLGGGDLAEQCSLCSGGNISRLSHEMAAGRSRETPSVY